MAGTNVTDVGAGLTDGEPGTVGTTRHWAVGDEDSVYLTVDTKAVTSGTGRGISKVNGVYTGVQDVDIEVLSTANNQMTGVKRGHATPAQTASILNDASVFAVADDDNYIIAAVVIGKDTSSTKNYGYILGDAEDETYEKEGDYHYWSFKGVLNGKIETLTIRKNDVDEFRTLRGRIQGWMSKTTATRAVDGFVEFEIDKDGYIVDAKRVADGTAVGDNANIADGGNVYDMYDFGDDTDPDIFKTYLMAWGTGRTQTGGTTVSNNTVFANFGTYSSQYTLHAGAGNPTEAGLTLAKDGTVVVIETEVYTGGETPKVVWTQFSDVKKAIEYLEKSDETDPAPVNRASAFDGWVAGPLNSKGTAQWIVLNTNQTKTVVTDGGGSKVPTGETMEITRTVSVNGGTSTVYDVYDAAKPVGALLTVQAPVVPGQSPDAATKSTIFVDGGKWTVNFDYHVSTVTSVSITPNTTPVEVDIDTGTLTYAAAVAKGMKVMAQYDDFQPAVDVTSSVNSFASGGNNLTAAGANQQNAAVTVSFGGQNSASANLPYINTKMMPNTVVNVTGANNLAATGWTGALVTTLPKTVKAGDTIQVTFTQVTPSNTPTETTIKGWDWTTAPALTGFTFDAVTAADISVAKDTSATEKTVITITLKVASVNTTAAGTEITVTAANP